MKRDLTELMEIAAAGGGLRLDGEEFTTSELINIAGAGRQHKAPLIVFNVSTKDTSKLVIIAAGNPGNVVFEF